MTKTRPSSAAGVEGEDGGGPHRPDRDGSTLRRSARRRSAEQHPSGERLPSGDRSTERRPAPNSSARRRSPGRAAAPARDAARPALGRTSRTGRTPEAAARRRPERDLRTAGTAPGPPGGSHGLLWGAVLTLLPYVIGVLTMLGWALLQDRLGEHEVLLAVTAAPYAALGTGLAWLLVLAMQYAPARRWRGITQGLAAAGAVYALAAAVAFGWYL